MLLPDGYWSPEAANGGIGGVLLLEGKQPQTWGCMIPDHLAAQLLSQSDGVCNKVQRNTQAELLAVLTTILTWRDELAGSCLLVLGDSTSSEANLRAGTAGNQHSREIVAQIHMLTAVYRIRLWYDWVPSKQNPGDPYSRPLTDAELSAELDKQCGAARKEPLLPMSIKMKPTAWREILKQPKPPTE